MRNATKILCRVLILMMAWTPFHLSHAGMIGTGEQIAITSPQSDRTAVLSLINRADVATELQSFGVDPTNAQERIAAMSDDEIQSLKGQLDAAPAGGNIGLVAILVVGLILWFVFWRKA